MAAFADYIVFADESGSPVLDNPDPTFPVFVLNCILVEKSVYANAVVPALQRLKFDFVGHDQLILHERDIRRQQNGFAFLQVDPAVRANFIDRMNDAVSQAEVTLVAAVIDKVKAKMIEVAKGFPEKVTFDIVYDRGELIKESVNSIKNTLIEEMIVVSIVVIIFLFHWRSALSIIIQIPITLATSFILLNAFGISSNIMSLTGIALAIGVVVDDGIVMVENAYRHLSEAQMEKIKSSNNTSL